MRLTGPLEDVGDGEWIEASFIYKKGQYYYLFVNWFGCCNGIDSTYEIHMGRSLHVNGPYVDKNGIDMREGGGSLLLQEEGRFIGPGHAGILQGITDFILLKNAFLQYFFCYFCAVAAVNMKPNGEQDIVVTL